MPEIPCASVVAPKVEYDPEKIQIYNEDTLGRFLNALDNGPDVKTKYRVLVYLALITGIRRGEVLALNWSAINFEQQQVHVRQSNEYIVGKPISTKDPKTKGSKRMLGISDDVVNLLILLQQEQNL